MLEEIDYKFKVTKVDLSKGEQFSDEFRKISPFSKTPVITSKGGCFKESGGKHSIYINTLSHEELSTAITKIKNDNNLRDYMTEKGYEYAQKFTDDKVAKNLINIYKNL